MPYAAVPAADGSWHVDVATPQQTPNKCWVVFRGPAAQAEAEGYAASLNDGMSRSDANRDWWLTHGPLRLRAELSKCDVNIGLTSAAAEGQDQ